MRETGVGEGEVDININNIFKNISTIDISWQFVGRNKFALPAKMCKYKEMAAPMLCEVTYLYMSTDKYKTHTVFANSRPQNY